MALANKPIPREDWITLSDIRLAIKELETLDRTQYGEMLTLEKKAYDEIISGYRP